MAIDKNYSYFLIEDTSGNTYRVPIAALGSLIVLNDEENERVNSLLEAINELSTYILNLSSEFVSEHYSLEELSSNFELLSETNSMITDKSNLTENDVYKFVKDYNIILRDDVDAMYDNESTDADRVFDSVANESDKYF